MLHQSHAVRQKRWACALASVLVSGSAASAQGSTNVAAPLDLPFANFFHHPVGPRGFEISDELRAAHGRSVRLVGYMVLQEEAQPGRFLLAPRPVQMSEHADGDADDLPPATVTVLLDDAQQQRVVAHQPGLVALTGRLDFGRQEDAAGKVSWVRLHLPPQATASTAARAAVPPPR